MPLGPVLSFTLSIRRDYFSRSCYGEGPLEGSKAEHSLEDERIMDKQHILLLEKVCCIRLCVASALSSLQYKEKSTVKVPCHAVFGNRHRGGGFPRMCCPAVHLSDTSTRLLHAVITNE